ncbi:CRISPR-associated endonuclease Cas2 [Desulfolithobacter sp.]
MYYIVCYDISDNRARYRVVKALKGFGYRVQKSVFECPDLTEKQLLDLQAKLEAYIDHGTDSIRYFRLCRSCIKDIEWTGAGSRPATESFRVV